MCQSVTQSILLHLSCFLLSCFLDLIPICLTTQLQFNESSDLPTSTQRCQDWGPEASNQPLCETLQGISLVLLYPTAILSHSA